MKNTIIFFVLFILITGLNSVNAQTNVPGGAVSGNWNLAGSPYLINGPIMIANGQTLTIDPGVIVSFQGNHQFYIQGSLQAIGSDTSLIVFTCADSTVGWKGIRFDQTPATNDTSKIYFCKIEYGKNPNDPFWKGGAMFFNRFSKVIVADCIISKNSAYYGGAINCEYSSPQFINNVITNNTASVGGGAFFMQGGNAIIHNNSISYNSSTLAYADGGAIWLNFSSPEISNNVISHNHAPDNGGGIFSSGNSRPHIIDNLLANNSAGDDGGGVFITNIDAHLYFINNVIVNNSADDGGGLYLAGKHRLVNNTISSNDAINGGGICLANSDSIQSEIFNSIIWGNSGSVLGDQVFLDNEGADPDFYNCNIEGGASGIVGDGVFYLGIYENNIELDPLFISPSSGSGDSFDGQNANWKIQNTSQCFDAGTLDVSGFTFPNMDIAGNSRVFNDTIDIGAYEIICPSVGARISQRGTTISNGDFSPSVADSTHIIADDVIYDPPIITFTLHNDSMGTLVLLRDKIILSEGTFFDLINLPISDSIPGYDSVLFQVTLDINDCHYLDSTLHDTISIYTNSCFDNPYKFALSAVVTGDILPDLLIPGDTTIACENLSNILLAEAIISGNCDSITLTNMVVPVNTTCTDTVLRIWTMSNTRGSQLLDTQQIVMYDESSPVINILNDTVIECSDYSSSLNWNSPGVSDNCDSAVLMNYSDSLIEGICVDTVIRRWTAIDDCGNLSSFDYRIILLDSMAPEFTSSLPQNQSYLSPGNSCSKLVPISVPELTDFCGDTAYVDIFSSDSTVDFFLFPLINEWYAEFPIGTTVVTITGTDSCGNFVSHDFNMTILENFPPQLMNCPEDVEGFANCDGFVSWQNPSVVDNCLPDSLIISFDLVSAYSDDLSTPSSVVYTGNDVYGGQNETASFSPGVTEVLFRSADRSGNWDTCSFNVEIPLSDRNTYFVDESSTGNGSGKDWANAYNSLYDLLENSCIDQIDTIKIAEGIYIPNTLDRNYSYSFSGNVVIIGGYCSGGTNFDPTVCSTVLSGNIGDNNVDQDNVKHVITILDEPTTIQMFNVAITDGYADGDGNGDSDGVDSKGAGILALGNAELTNIHVHNNFSVGNGAGMTLYGSSKVRILENSKFESNTSSSGVTFETLEGASVFIGENVYIE